VGDHEHDHPYGCDCGYCARERALRANVRRAEDALKATEHLACDQLMICGGKWTDRLEEMREQVFAARKELDAARAAEREG
jgi:hypothetical protein